MKRFERETYQEIKQLTDRAMLCITKKETKPYIEQLSFIKNGENALVSEYIAGLCRAIKKLLQSTKYDEQLQSQADIKYYLFRLEDKIAKEGGDRV